jgi:hypothetical protein
MRRPNDHRYDHWLTIFTTESLTSDPVVLFGVKAASSLYSVPGRRGLYVITWEKMSDWASWCWWLLEGMFPPCSFSNFVINMTGPLKINLLPG